MFVTSVEADLLARAQHAVEAVLRDCVFVEVLGGMLIVNPPPSFDHAPWVLIVDPDAQTLRWYHRGQQHPSGPDWAAGLHAGAVFR